MTTIDAVIFYDLLIKTFSADDLADLAFRVGVDDYADIPGDTRPAKARGLIRYCSFRGQLEALLAKAQELRPHLDWFKETRPAAAAPAPPSPAPLPDDDPVRELRVFRGLLDEAWGVFINQNNQRTRLYNLISANHPELVGHYRGYDDLFYNAYDQLDSEEKELFTLVRGMTKHAAHRANSRIRDWLDEHPLAELLPDRTPAVIELEGQAKLLAIHLEQWFAKYNEVFLPDQKRTLVYLGDEKSHGVPWPRGLEPAVDAVIAEQSAGQMRVTYDRKTDTLAVLFSDSPVAESTESRPGVILDYDATGNLVSLAILEASRRVVVPTRVQYAAGG